MKTVLIKNGYIISPANGYRGEKKDILIQNGKITKVAEEIQGNENVIDVSGCIVTPGFIDIHTHCYPDTFLGMMPDTLGIERGSTTIIDAGSSGADNYKEFRENYIDKAKTKVFTLLNLSKEGLIRGHELDDLQKIDLAGLNEILKAYDDNIVGLKVRASASVVGDLGMEPIEIGAKTAQKTGKSLTVHVGNYPPALTDVLNLLGKGDIVTHAFHGKKGGILDDDGYIIPEAREARERGVLFDIGHGEASFSFRVFQQALREGFDCDIISTDLHQGNYNGPVYNLAAVATKVINCGESLEEAIEKCTSVPAKHYGLKELGEIQAGYIADLNIMELTDCQEEAQDSIGDSLAISRKLILKKTLFSRGEESEIFEHAIGR